jgi:hypothetical protein
MNFPKFVKNEYRSSKVVPELTLAFEGMDLREVCVHDDVHVGGQHRLQERLEGTPLAEHILLWSSGTSALKHKNDASLPI